MGILHAFLLAVVQGITEFLPISSSAHLVLLPIIMQWQDQGVVIDIAAHFGSLLAVLIYFRKDLQKLTQGWFESLGSSGVISDDGRLAWCLLWATLPIMIAALLLQNYIVEYVRDPIVIGSASIVFGVLLWWADRQGKQTQKITQLTTGGAVLIGLAQAVALIPGASRSGVTMTAGLWLGLTRVEATRFSFLLAIPTIFAASFYASYCAFQQAAIIQWGLALGVVICSAAVALLCIHWFIKFISTVGMLPFVAYRILLGIVLLVIYM